MQDNDTRVYKNYFCKLHYTHNGIVRVDPRNLNLIEKLLYEILYHT